MPVSRVHVAELLFPTAEDPLAALSWALSMLRRLVGDAARRSPGRTRRRSTYWRSGRRIRWTSTRSATSITTCWSRWPRLLDAGRRASRLPDGYLWVRAYVLDALATLGVARHRPPAGEWVAEPAGVADRSGMTELTVRAAVHRWRLGNTAGRDVARAFGATVDNPALSRLLDEL